MRRESVDSPLKALAGVVEEADDLLIEICLQWKSLETPSSLRAYVRSPLKIYSMAISRRGDSLVEDIEFIPWQQTTKTPMFRCFECGVG